MPHATQQADILQNETQAGETRGRVDPLGSSCMSSRSPILLQSAAQATIMDDVESLDERDSEGGGHTKSYAWRTLLPRPGTLDPRQGCNHQKVNKFEPEQKKRNQHTQHGHSSSKNTSDFSEVESKHRALRRFRPRLSAERSCSRERKPASELAVRPRARRRGCKQQSKHVRTSRSKMVGSSSVYGSTMRRRQRIHSHPRQHRKLTKNEQLSTY